MGWLNKDRSEVVKGTIKMAHDIRGMVDDKNFTAEEKSRSDLEYADANADFYKTTLSESTARSITRRTVAVDTVRFFFLLTAFIIGSWKFDEEWARFAMETVVEFKLPQAFIMIMAFFFGGYYLNKLPAVNKVTEKVKHKIFGKKKPDDG